MGQKRAEETHSAILNAAAAAFAQHGYDNASVADICRRAGVSKGAFYYHVSSKEELFLELLHRWLNEIDRELNSIDSEPASASSKLLHMSETISPLFEVHAGQLPIFLEFWSRAARDSAVWEATITPYRRYRAFFAEIIQEGIDEGTLRSVDPDRTARVIVGLAVGMVLQSLIDAEGDDWGETIREGVHMLLRGIEREQGA